jgi:hypothetical protein
MALRGWHSNNIECYPWQSQIKKYISLFPNISLSPVEINLFLHISLSPRRERVRVRGEFDFYFVISNIITKSGK